MACPKVVYWGPTLFLLYINDFAHIVTGLNVKSKLIANDVKLVHLDSSIDLYDACKNCLSGLKWGS